MGNYVGHVLERDSQRLAETLPDSLLAHMPIVTMRGGVTPLQGTAIKGDIYKIREIRYAIVDNTNHPSEFPPNNGKGILEKTP